ncbi:MAG: hypothetical protein WC243_04525 [Patescibacteria group bacterium]|jgi:hypothetical protein
MKVQLKRLAPILPAFLTVMVLPVYSYTSFISYKPEISEEHLRKVSGAASYFEDVPFPQDANIISQDNTAGSQTATIETQKTPQEVQEFYDSALTSNGWKIETRDQKGEVFIYEYKKEDKRVMVTSSTGQGVTVLTINLSQL